MQNLRALDGSKPDLEISAPPVALSAFAPRLLGLELLTSLGSAALAALPFGVLDIVRASSALGGWVGISIAGALLGLWFWFGVALGLALWLSRLLAATIKPRLPSWLAWHAVLALTAGAFTLLLARKVFAGAGVRGTLLSSWGTWGLPLAVTLAAWVALWLSARLAPVGVRSSWRRPTIFLAVSLAFGAVLLDALAPDAYLYLHVLLLGAGLVLATEAVDLIGLGTRTKQFALALTLLTLPALLAFPSSLRARELVAEPRWAGYQLVLYAQIHLDSDHDGHSNWFGGGDCNDRDASVFAGAPEKAGDGVDSNCDGFDDPKVPSLAFAPLQVQSAQSAQSLAERAKKYPTVVLLIDALRFDRVGDSRFPNLAQLSRESIRFTHTYATSSATLSSVPAMVTGRVRPARSRENIAQSLRRANQISVFIAPDMVMKHFRILEELDPLASFSALESIDTDYRKAWLGSETVATSEQITARAIALVDAQVSPDLVWLHYFDVHQWDNLEVPGLSPHGDVARYDEALERMDASLRPLLERRDRLNLVLLADHGEALGARGIKHHTAFVFEELAHVPFLIRIPGTEPVDVDVPITSTALFNTLRELRGLEPDATVDVGALELVGDASAGNGPGFASFEQQQWSLLYGNHRLLYMPRQQLVELYDVAHDSREQKNLVDVEPQLASEMLERLFQLHNEPRQ